jgi:transcription factor IIIB subunit 2
LQKSTQQPEQRINLVEWKDDMPEEAICEIDDLFRSEEEMTQKEAIFNSLNKDYLIQQERKESERLSAEAASKDKEKDDAAQAEGHARYVKSSGRRKRRRGDSADAEAGEEPTTEEALFAAVSSRKISRKINYDAMSAIFDEDGTFATPQLDDPAAGRHDEAAEGMEEEEMVDPVLAMV